MKNILKILYIFIVILSLFGCQNSPENYSLLLLNPDGSIHQQISELDKEEVQLPILTANDNQIFIGWDDGETIFYDSYIVKNQSTLSARFENIDDVFEWELDDATQQVFINGYQGEAKHLVIPQDIFGYPVSTISTHAFYESHIESIEIPLSVTSINNYAFEDAKLLEDVSYYGYIESEFSVSYNEEYFFEELNKYTNNCLIESVSVIDDSTITYYEQGCPIIRSEERLLTDQDDEPFTIYTMTYDLFVLPEYAHHLIYPFAFSGASSLKRIELPVGFKYVFSETFSDLPNLEEIVIDERNLDFKVVDNMILSKDETIMYYYPNGKTESSFVIPDQVTRIMPFAFYQNERLEEIVIHKDVKYLSSAFVDMRALKRFVVNNKRSDFFTIDGVLFSRDRLVSYPGGKTDLSYIVPEEIIIIDRLAFAYNRFLESVTLSSQTRYIGNHAFYMTSSISLLDIPSSIEWIGNYIADRSSIRTIIIRRSIDGSPRYTTFSKDMRFHPDIYVPDDSLEAYLLVYENTEIEDFIFPLSDYEE